MVKIFDFIISEIAQNYQAKGGEINRPKASTIEEIERQINNECDNIKSINTNTYTSYRHNNADTDEVHIVYTIVCD